MKKYFLILPIIVYFLLVVAGTGNSGTQKLVLGHQDVNSLYTIAEANYPHTELEVNHQSVSVNSSSRHQVPQNFVAATENVHHSFPIELGWDNKRFPNISAKQYLDHIYPTHNFW